MDKESSGVSLAMTDVLDSSYAAIGYCDLSSSKSMPVGQEACKTCHDCLLDVCHPELAVIACSVGTSIRTNAECR